MFLITTANQRFWKTDGPVLFLGEWCKIFSERDIWEKLEHETLPYHWDDRKKLYRDYLYLNQIYEKTLVQLSDSVNKIHGESHSVRYWRIIIGPWLYYFILTLYDRYQSILTAQSSGKVTNMLILKYKAGEWIPKDFNEFKEWSFKDEYNHYLCSQIVEFTDKLPYEIKNIQRSATTEKESKQGMVSSKNIIKNILKMSYKFTPDFFNRVVFVSSYLGKNDLIKLQLTLGQFPYLFPPEVKIPVSEIDFNKRRDIYLNLHDDNEFIHLLSRLLPGQIPQCYLESYYYIKKEAIKSFPSRPKIIFTANAHIADEGFKIWTASCIEEGTMFIGTQHGGAEGMVLWCWLEDHQYAVWDKYYSWGWEDDLRKKIKPLPAAKLNNMKRIQPNRKGRILMVVYSFPRYFYNMATTIVGASGYNTYLNNIFAFMKFLKNMTRELLTVRLYPDDYKCCQKERFAEKYPDVECYLGKMTMYEQLTDSRLFIGTAANATTYLEAFAANFPSILFWNPEHGEIRPIAQPFFDKLWDAGILHDTPQSAAKLVNEIYDDPLSWWQQPEVQKAKDEFCLQFARTSKNWRKEWAENLKGLNDNLS
jgi:putative transferase (TIGR04331 family)